jgi:hypothetical protein
VNNEEFHWHDGPDEFIDYGVAGGGWVPTKWKCYKPDCRLGRTYDPNVWHDTNQNA